MPIKINEKILSIPPYISTSWSHITALHIKGNLLVIVLIDGDTINIPGLSKETIELIFNHHATYLENESFNLSHPPSSPKKESLSSLLDQVTEPTIRLAFGSLDGLGAVMQHNPAQANAPTLPPELLQKISGIAKIIAPLEDSLLPKAELSCNCFYCQIARALNPQNDGEEELKPELEEIKDEELQFQQWNIIQTGNNLFSVINRLDDHEKYSVYLGHPVGCTCGKQGCEHILAVLKS